MHKNLRFFKNLNQGNTTGYNYTWTLSNKQAAYYKQNQQERQYEDAIAKSGDNVFFGINPTKTPKSASQRATNKDVCRLNAVFLDLDGKNEKKPNNPDTAEELIEFLENTILPSPNYIVGSGNGIHAYWIVKEGFFIKSDDDRAKAQALTKGFNSLIQSEGKKLGFSFDGVGDLARIGRMPGTFNNKNNTPKLVEIVHESDELFTFEELTGFLPEREQKDLDSQRRRTNSNTETDYSKASYKSIFAGCAFIRHCENKAKDLEEPSWYHAISIVARCEDGRSYCHEISERYDGYSFEEVERKIDHALGATSGPTTCEHIATGLNFEGCRNCPLRHSTALTSPIGLGLIKPEVANLVGRYIYVLKTNQFYEVAA